MNIVERNSRFKLIKKILFGIGLILILFIGVALEVNIRKNYEVMSIDKYETKELQKLATSDGFENIISVGTKGNESNYYCPGSMNFSTPWRISAANAKKSSEIMFCRDYETSFIFSAGKNFRVSNGQQYADYVPEGGVILDVPQSIAYYNYYFPIQTDYYSGDEDSIDPEKDKTDRSRQLVIWTADTWKDATNTNLLPKIEERINKEKSRYSINPVSNSISIGTVSENELAPNQNRNFDAETRAIQYANFRYYALKEVDKNNDTSASIKNDVKLGIRLVDAEKVIKDYFVYPDNDHKEEYDNIINNNTLSTSNKEELTNGYLNDQNDYENKGFVDISSNEITSQNTRCLVDNEKKEYLFGPYMLSFDNMNYKFLNSGMTAGTLTYNEIIKQNPGQYEINSGRPKPSGMIDANNTFCYGSFKSTIIRQGEDENSSTLTTSAKHKDKNQFDVNYNEYSVGSDGTGFEIIYTDDGTKEENNFPQFGKSFYIKYKSKDEEIPVRNIKIEARVKYTKYIHMRAQKYKSVAVYANPGKTTVPKNTDGQKGRSLINQRTYRWGEGVYEKQQIDKAGVVVGDPLYKAFKAGSSTQQTLVGERVYYDKITGDEKVNTFENGKYDVKSGLLGGIINYTELRYKQELQTSDQDLSKIAVNMGLYVGFAYLTDAQSQAQSYTGRIYLYDPGVKKVSSANVENNSATIETEETEIKDFTMLDRLEYDHSDPQDLEIIVRRAWGTAEEQKEKHNTHVTIPQNLKSKLFDNNGKGRMLGDIPVDGDSDMQEIKTKLLNYAKDHRYTYQNEGGGTSDSIAYVILEVSEATWIHHYKIKPELETGEFTLSYGNWYYSGSDIVTPLEGLNSIETCTREIEVHSPISTVDPIDLKKHPNINKSVKEEVLKNDSKIKTSFMVVLYKSPSPILVIAKENAIQPTITFADLNQHKKPFTGDVSENIPGISLGITWGTEEIYTPYKQDDYSMYLGGTVWRENGEIKTENTDKEYRFKRGEDLGQDMPYSGVQVSLYDTYLKRVVGLTTTDKNGTYGFRNLNPVHKYKVYYTYNGMYYEDIDERTTDMKQLLAGGYTNAHDNGTRSENANRFSKILSSNANYENKQSENMSIDNLGITDSNVIGTNMLNPGGSKITDTRKFGYILKNRADGSELIPQNYDSKFTYIGGEKKAYGYYTKIEDANGKYISFNKSDLQGIIADGEYQNGDNTPSMDNPEGTTNYGALRFCDVWNIFQGLAYNNNEIYNATKEQMDGISRENHIVEPIFTKIYNGYLDISRANLVDANGNVISGNGFVRDERNPTLCMVDDAFFRKYDRFIDMLRGLGISENEANNLLSYILDTMVTAETDYDYALYKRFALLDIDLSYKGCPENLKDYMTDQQIKEYTDENGNKHDYYDTITKGGYETPVVNTPAKFQEEKYFYLYTRNCDQSRNVDFGVVRRKTSDLALQKDVYNVTTIINGEEETYRYNQKKLDRVKEGDLDEWDITVRASDVLYNGVNVYNRPIRRSEYLYNGSDAYTADANTADAKNLQVLVTYRIAVKNSGMVPMRLEEIVDYYDSDRYIFDSEGEKDGYLIPRRYKEYDENGKVLSDKSKTYLQIRDENGNIFDRIDKIRISNDSKNGGTQGNKGQINKQKCNYNSLYITGFDETLDPGEMYLAYVTFKVKNDTTTNRIIMDEVKDDILQASGFVGLGGKNIAEINAYSNAYSKDNKELSVSDKGIVDFDSNPGSLNPAKDLDDEGKLIYRTGENGKYDPVESRGEDDIDKAPNVMLKIQDDDRAIKGYVFEDERNKVAYNAYIGDGKYTDNENKINGVTVQLVELVKDVDEKGMFTGRYTGEHIWNTMNYSENYDPVISEDRYASGRPESRIILTSDINKLKAEPDEGLGDGEYSFKSVPPGDFIIRFIYGDTPETVLTNDTNSSVNQLLGETGLNAKSYNGQDYKSTIYQAEQDQDGSYNGILSYSLTGKNLNTVDLNNIDIAGLNANQNYTKYSLENDALNITLNDGTDKRTMYWYNIDDGNDENNDIESSNSDAKDIYAFRELCNAYSKGATPDGTNDDTLENYRAEVLASFEKVGTYQNTTLDDTDKLRQIKMLQELIDNTKMVAQTGVINTQVEYNKKDKEVQYDKDQKDGGHLEQYAYEIKDVNLGLVERPKAGLKLTKSVTNLKITLANGQIMFDSNKTVKNLFYKPHEGHNVSYTHEGLRLANASINENNTRFTPELINAYMDDELMDGATIEVLYKIRVDNIGEVDYIDNRFYYTGIPISSSENYVSKTSAPIVVDYVSNTIKYDRQRQNDNTKWDIRTPSDLMPSIEDDDDKKFASNKDFVNRQYSDEITTYNMLLTTQKLDGELMPQTYYVVKEGDNAKNNINTFKETELILSTLLSNSDSENAVYNNLTEIIQVKNTQGRRMQYSIVGNQEMADQSIGNNPNIFALSNVDLVTPTEIDADSAQKIMVLPPTGENKDYKIIIITALGALTLLMSGVILTIYAFRKTRF